MNRHRWERSSLALVLSLALAWPALAQEPAQELDRDGLERGQGAGKDGSSHFEAKKRERLLKALHLDEATQSRLNQRLAQLEEKGADLRRQRKDAFEALREQAQGLRKGKGKGKGKGMTQDPREEGGRTVDDAPHAIGPAVDRGALKQTLDRVYAVEDAIAEMGRERVRAVRDILTPEQQVAYLFNTMRLQKDLRERLRRQ